MTSNGSIRSFTDLHAWQKGHKIVIDIYSQTKKFPKEEMFGLTNQLRRAIVSFTSNIAEGFSRNSYKEKLQFYYMAIGSLTEVQNQLLIARDVGYMTQDEFNQIANKTIEAAKITQGPIKSTKMTITPSHRDSKF
ncbi:four helix bundle protein [Candidatus Uhrbacteria bacterium]|nr:four helix bundle protein [Candidatus Uhrbacteria bacterium]